MTPEETTIVKVLVAVAWADGDMQVPESGVIEGLLAGFDASAAETADMLEYARTPRSLRDIPIVGLSYDDKDLLMRNAALLICADGVESEPETILLKHLATILELSEKEAVEIIVSVRQSLQHLNRGSREN